MADEQHEALGLIETRGLVAAIEAADAMLKASSVRLLRIEKTEAALMTVQVVGETAAVQASVDAGRAAAERIGVVVSAHVIPRPAAEVAHMQALSDALPVSSPASSKAGKTSHSAAIEDMTVRELRAYAREQEDLPIKGREIARANRQQLLDALRKR